MKLVDAGNYFNKKAFDEICAELEKAQAVEVYIDCIGHTRNNDTQEDYKEALIEKYRDRLKVDRIDGGYSYSYQYGLKYFAGGGKDA